MNKILLSILMFISSAAVDTAQSIELLEGDSASISDGVLIIHDQTGAPVFTHTTNSNQFSRDIEIIDNTTVAFWSDDPFEPRLTLLDLSTLTENKFNFSDWSTVNNLTFGGIAYYDNALYLTDMSTANAPQSGIIRFDLESQTYSRIISGNEYIALEVSTNGLLYALRDDYFGSLDIIDPSSASILETVNFEATDPRGLIPTQDGNIIIVELGGNIKMFNTQGQQLDSYDTGFNYTNDIDINNNGDYLLTNWDGHILRVDGSLTQTSIVYSYNGSGMPFLESFVLPEPRHEPPVLTGASYRKGKWIHTSLQWVSTAEVFDVYLNGEFIEAISSASANYTFEKFISQEFIVCNSGTGNCSSPFVAHQ